MHSACRAVLLALAVMGCGASDPRDGSAGPVAGPVDDPVVAPAGAEVAPDVEEPGEVPAPGQAADGSATDGSGAGSARIEMSLHGNTIVPAGGMSQPDGWSLVRLTFTAGEALRLDVRLAPGVAGDPARLFGELLAEANRAGGAQIAVQEQDDDQLVASAELPRRSLTLATRAFDVTGGRLSVSGLDLGPVAGGSEVILAPDGVSVDGERRGDLPD
jgi:hypothetical protein